MVVSNLISQRITSDFIELFILETPDGNQYFTNYHENVWFSDRDSPYTRRQYTKLPIEFSGFEHRAEGAYARPQATFSNVLRTLPNLTDPDNLIGRKLTRRKTLETYLPAQSSGDGPAPTELPQQIFIIDRITEENNITITFELTTAFDLEGVTVPNRYILGNVCSWLYQGRAPDRASGVEALGACKWRKDNTLKNDSSFVVAFDSNNRVLLDSSTNTGAIDISGVSGDVTANYVYKRQNSPALTYTDGTGSPGASDYGYYTFWQAQSAVAADPFNSLYYRRVRMYSAYSAATAYKTFNEGILNNPCVSYNNKIYVAVIPSQGTTPGTDENVWRRIDVCGKALTSCAVRYRAVKFTDQSNIVIPSATTQDREEVLPYGGFPAAKRYNR